MGHGTLTKQFFIAFHMIFQPLDKKYEIKTGKCKLIYAKMCFDKLIEIVKIKIFIKFHSIKIMIHLGWVANSIVIFSASHV